MQLIHSAYNLQNWYESDELKEMYLFVTEKLEITDEKYEKVPEPIVTQC